MTQSEASDLSPQEYQRYARHLSLPEVGVAGQRRLRAGSVLLVGAGGLGSPLAMYLAAAGVGRLGLVDFDRVDASNLQRQVIHGTKDLGRPKVDSAAEAITDINPHVRVDRYEEPLTSENALRIAEPYQLVIDGTDNFPTRYLVNDICVLQGKPNCYGSVFRFEGQASVFHHDGGPCYRCLYPEPPPPGAVPSCAEGGVLGILPGVIGMIQATEAIKILLGAGSSLSGRLLLFDALEMRFREMRVRRDPGCPVCGEHPSITRPIDYHQFCGVPSAAMSINQPDRQSDWDVQPAQLKQRIDAGDVFTLIDVRQPHEYEICNLDGVLIPLDELPERHAEIPREGDVIIHCKMGGRSSRAVEYLRELGYRNVYNLRGGVLAWAEEIDPNLPTY